MDGRESGVAGVLMRAIGVVRAAQKTKAEAARQAAAAKELTGRIELYPGRNLEHALDDLAEWERIWVVFWFHLNKTWRPKVLPPRSRSGRKGVLATRSPHRPNPIGLSAVRLERIEGRTLFVRDIDMLDGTPVLDIKPYVAYTDAHPKGRNGWLDAPADPLKPYVVTFDARAGTQAAWVETRTGLSLGDRISATLALGPAPHAYRRIRREGENYRLAIQDWRATFSVDARQIRVLAIHSGYRPAQLAAATDRVEDPLSAHRAFVASWQ